ncbi:GtrA family protein [Romboutsia ilealis]|uniref:GtrA family protein n=1 Tax=Romboutsia faecis TaxID=2764597 RepID=A0ABR7JMZ7_9FIRM|nr:GtrA family protein [Romboutsia faecis]MBC5996284.1 GtrA family protein [Romboutsia faecis]MRN25075.1 GtrA family protein [Romboutsia ilealis]
MDIKKYKESILYLIFGGLTFLVNMITYVLFTRVVKADVLVSNCIAWIAAVLFAYITNKFFVFKSKETDFKYILKEFRAFVGCRLFSGIVELGIIFVMATLMGINDLFVKIVTNIVVIVLNFIFSKLIIFKKEIQV